MSDRLNRAIVFAANAHRDKKRKIEETPYILHPFEAAAIASRMTSDEDVLIAALLHDTVEDTDTTIEEIRQLFGDRTADLVAHETENKYRDLPPESSWKMRKEESLAALRDTKDRDVKILWLSDKLSNIRSLYRSYIKMGDRVFEYFHEKNKANQAWYYRTTLSYLSELAGEPACQEYAEIIEKIFGEGE